MISLYVWPTGSAETIRYLNTLQVWEISIFLRGLSIRCSGMKLCQFGRNLPTESKVPSPSGRGLEPAPDLTRG